jgi:hypothetical protein
MKILILLILVAGCAQVTSLNMRKQEFGVTPTKIIWFQIGGLQAEQLAMLRYRQNGDRKTSFEQSICMGQTWAYNLYKIRSSAEASFLSQITGKKNIKASCEDAELRPVWNFINSHGYATGVLEIGASASQSLLSFNKCADKGTAFLNSLFYWLQQDAPAGSPTFYYSDEIALKANEPNYDRSCRNGICSSMINDNVKGIYTAFNRSSNKSLFIVRDFSYLAALEKKNFNRAREILADLERTYAYALDLSRESNEYLVLVTSGDSRFVDMPDQGKNWYEFEKGANNAQAKRTMLTNVVFANGARAENFCGFYEDADVLERMLSGPKQQGLELRFINPLR